MSWRRPGELSDARVVAGAEARDSPSIVAGITVALGMVRRT
jgi:hypothetical protein